VLIIAVLARVVVRLVDLLFLEIERGAIVVPGIHQDAAQATRQCARSDLDSGARRHVPVHPQLGHEAFRAIGVSQDSSSRSARRARESGDERAARHLFALAGGEFINTGQVTGS
jgi:hypothetical protein